MDARNDLSVIAFTGGDADTFLHNQLTQDIRSLASGEATFAALCQPKGRVVALLLVVARDGGFRVVVSRELADPLVTHLRRFVFRDQVEIEASREQVVGPVAPTVETLVDGLIAEPLPRLRYGLTQDTADGDANATAAARARELEAGVAWLGAETSEQFLPQMLGHEAIGALSFRKGCFPGQEVIARTRYLGKLKRHPWCGVIDEALPVGILDECELAGGETTASAVLVDQARGADGRWRVLLVARRKEPFEVDQILVKDTRSPAAGRWLSDDAGDDSAA